MNSENPIDLTFIALESPAAHVGRVEDRVNARLHDVPEDQSLARYDRALLRLSDAVRVADHMRVIDNSSVTVPFQQVLKIEGGRLMAMVDVLPAWVERPLAAMLASLRS